MKLGARITPDSVVIYREKWGVLAFGVALGGALIGFAVWFYTLGAEHAPPLFLIPFCAAFALAGAAVWWRLPNDARKMFQQDGLTLLRADVDGVEIVPLPGGASSHYRWSDLSEITFVDRLKIVEIDETIFSWRQLVLFPRKEALPGASRFNVALAGLAHSGEGRAYASIDYSREDADTLFEALRARAPAGVTVRRWRSACFDRKARTDFYD